MYAVVGDGELAEGQLWEAFMAAAAYGLDTLRVIVDCNGLQATGATSERFPIPRLQEKLEAFGFCTFSIDGHDIPQILRALREADSVKGRPTAILAHTVKGKGISFAENNAAFHNGTMTQEQYETALRELEEKEGDSL